MNHLTKINKIFHLDFAHWALKCCGCFAFTFKRTRIICHLSESFEFICLFTALTTNTRSQRSFFIRFKPSVWWTSINRYHGFNALAKRRFFPRFSSTRRNMPAFKPFLQYFATGSDTASC